jgi:hypothetical protein
LPQKRCAKTRLLDVIAGTCRDHPPNRRLAAATAPACDASCRGAPHR